MALQLHICILTYLKSVPLFWTTLYVADHKIKLSGFFAPPRAEHSQPSKPSSTETDKKAATLQMNLISESIS